MSRFQLPNDTQRSTVIGRTGSGKTQGAVWQLSQRSITSIPWIIFDFKHDPLIAKIPYAEQISVGEIPDKPGVFVVRPRLDQFDEIEKYLWKIWEHEHVGVFFDEGYMLGKSPAFISILTQGRSKHIPAIILTQRPTLITRFAFSEADFFQVYRLLDRRDIKTVQEFIPYDFERPFNKFWSLWYDAGEDISLLLRPVPKEDIILDTFRVRLAPQPEPEPVDPDHLGRSDPPPQKRFILI